MRPNKIQNSVKFPVYRFAGAKRCTYHCEIWRRKVGLLFRARFNLNCSVDGDMRLLKL